MPVAESISNLRGPNGDKATRITEAILFDSRASFPAAKASATDSHKPVSTVASSREQPRQWLLFEVSNTGVARAANVMVFRHPEWA